MSKEQHLHLKPEYLKGDFKFNVSFAGSKKLCPDCEYDRLIELNDLYAVMYNGVTYPKGTLTREGGSLS